jgi:hypothetical protein
LELVIPTRQSLVQIATVDVQLEYLINLSCTMRL